VAFTENIPALFADLGVTASSGGYSAVVFFDEPTRNILGDMVLAEEPAITLPTVSLPDLAYGDAITVDDVDYTVREVMRIDDGKLKRVTLKAA
jgi:hypothetical protein